MKAGRFFIVFLILTVSHICNSTESVRQKIQVKNGLISLLIPPQWHSTKDLFGVPLTLLGPETDGARPVILFTPTGVNNITFKKWNRYPSNWL
jgi:hypothetical protein